SLQYLRVFAYIDAVARAGSIRKAAESLFITASALDRRVQDIEAEFGTPLFERHARGMRLTAAGELFLQHVRAQRADFERIHSEIEHLKGLRRGTVSIAASQALAFHLLPELLNRFRRTHPGIEFKVRIDDRTGVVAALRAFDADLGIVYNALPATDLAFLLNVEQRLCAVMATTHPLAKEAKLKMRDCITYPFALPERGLGGRALLDGFFARSSLQPQIALESNSFEMLRNFVRTNDALSFQIQVGTPLARAQDGVVARVVDEQALPRLPLSVVQLKGRHLPQPALRFLEVLRAELGGDR
ncbi:MAG: LysR family transcriptional regulator, partial [Burkholderiales bacterium]